MADKLTIEEMRKQLAEAGRGGKISKWIRNRLVLASLKAESDAKLNATTSPRVRSGRLRASIRANVDGGPAGAVMSLRAGGGPADVSYARLQELGGRVVPTTGRFLAIPAAAAKTAAGVSRFASPRDVPGLRFVPRAGGKGMLVDEEGVPMFWLVRSVTIRPKLYLRRAFDAAERTLPRTLRDVLEVSLAGTGAP